VFPSNAQPTAEKDIEASYAYRRKMAESSWMKNFPVRNIGPTIQGGRIVDIEVNLKNPNEFYLGFGSAGIFKTVNNGITFEPIFDQQDALGIGDFALSQTDPLLIYVGTGEKNSSRSSYAGSGVYKTTDGGKNWTHIGLTQTQHISRVLIHPQDNNTVWVAALGSLYTNNPERGVFKSTDGGKSWKKTLYINDSTGVIDLVVNPKDPKHLLAATWERTRKAWNFKGNGVGSAIYLSDDGGETWKRSTTGFPEGKFVGRIGLDICLSNPDIVYAILDNQQEVEDKKKPKAEAVEKLKLEDFKKMAKEDFLKLDDKKLDEFLKDSGLPKHYNASIVKKEVREGKYLPKAISEYFGSDANQNLFRTKIIGAEVYRSDDGGKSWKKRNTCDLDGVFYTYGYYFAEMRVTPDNPDLIYIYGVPMLKSKDGGATWHRIDTLSGVRELHVDHHALWINPRDRKHLLLGNDGGLYQSYDEGANWVHINNIPAGQFYSVNVDMQEPYHVYGGLQDNGTLRGSSKSIPNETKHWKPLFSGDGMLVSPDPRRPSTVYVGYQFGNYYRLDLETQRNVKITPQHKIGESPLRWNWRTPMFLSKHNYDIVYMASHQVHRSLDKGETWETISPDLTKNKKAGNVPISTISSLAESPKRFGLLYAGTDDGNVWVSRNGGGTWDDITAGLPQNRWISSIFPSPHDDATVYISLNGYRDDEFKTYLFVSTDYGKNWKSVNGNLPESVANVIIQDPLHADILYCGLDNGTYVSLDNGLNWSLINQFLNVAAYDMIIHPRDLELIVGTHGRSVYVADVKPLHKIKTAGQSKGVIAFQPEDIRHSDQWGEKDFEWDQVSTPKVPVLYYVGKTSDAVVVEIFDEKGALKRKLSTNGSIGFHTFTWDVKVNAASKSNGGKKTKTVATTEPLLEYAEKGKYKIKFSNKGDVEEVMMEIK
jgi:photosystem II stability/assembly factor-like uncharacterized protein